MVGFFSDGDFPHSLPGPGARGMPGFLRGEARWNPLNSRLLRGPGGGGRGVCGAFMSQGKFRHGLTSSKIKSDEK